MPSLSEILSSIQDKQFYGNPDINIEGVINFDGQNANPAALMWVNDTNLPKANNLQCGTLICSQLPENDHPACNYIIVNNPRSVFREVLEKFFKPARKIGISISAIIHPTTTLGKDVYIGEYVIIEENSIIGDNVSIGHHTVIMHGTVIKNNVTIGSNNTIGGVGFGYDKDPEGTYQLIPHLGNVHLEENVEIGNNTCIDRAVMGSTFLKENVKVDNLVHIAHGVQIGKNSLIIANSMVAGSAIIGENVWVAPSSSIINKCTVANNSLIGMGAVVIKPVNENEVIIGNPGKVLTRN